MTRRTRNNSKFHISIVACAVAGGFLLGACGGGSSDDGAGAATPGGGDADLEQASEPEGSPAAKTSDDATATVVLDGTTYVFKSNPDATLETRTFCSSISNSLQGDLLLVDDSGAFVEDGEVSFGLFEPDSDFAGDGVGQDITLSLPTDPGVIGPITYLSDADTIESEVSGRSATATFTARHGSGDLPATIEISC